MSDEEMEAPDTPAEHIRRADGSCVISVNGQGHLPCGIHPGPEREDERMSECISPRGEFSEHTFDGETLGSRFNCARCFMFDEDAADQAVKAAEARIAELEQQLDRMRHHVISDPEMRALHENAKAYSLAVQALNKKRGGPLSTTLAFLIEQDFLVPNDPRSGERTSG